MIDFNLKPYEWQKDMEVVMENVDLSEICFLDNVAMSFVFHNTYNGGFYKKILCHNVWKFSKDINMWEGEGFNYFICDIRVAKLVDVEIEGAFSYLRYGLTIPQSNEYNLLCMDSGDISINLICKTIEII